MSVNVSLHDAQSELFWRIAQEVHRNGSAVFLHVVLCRSNIKGKGLSIPDVIANPSLFKTGDAIHGWVRLIKHSVIPRSFHFRYLLSDFGLVEVSQDDSKYCW